MTYRMLDRLKPRLPTASLPLHEETRELTFGAHDGPHIKYTEVVEVADRAGLDQFTRERGGAHTVGVTPPRFKKVTAELPSGAVIECRNPVEDGSWNLKRWTGGGRQTTLRQVDGTIVNLGSDVALSGAPDLNGIELTSYDRGLRQVIAVDASGTHTSLVNTNVHGHDFRHDTLLELPHYELGAQRLNAQVLRRFPEQRLQVRTRWLPGAGTTESGLAQGQACLRLPRVRGQAFTISFPAENNGHPTLEPSSDERTAVGLFNGTVVADRGTNLLMLKPLVPLDEIAGKPGPAAASASSVATSSRTAATASREPRGVATFLVPETLNSGQPVSAETISSLHKDLLQQFGGFNRQDYVHGTWRDDRDGQVYHDRLQRYEVSLNLGELPRLRARLEQLRHDLSQEAIYLKVDEGSRVELLGRAEST